MTTIREKDSTSKGILKTLELEIIETTTKIEGTLKKRMVIEKEEIETWEIRKEGIEMVGTEKEGIEMVEIETWGIRKVGIEMVGIEMGKRDLQ
jgi:hypothetical protein